MIEEGTHVVIVDNSSNRRVLKIKHNKKIKHFKIIIDLGKLIRTDFGVHYQVTDPKTGELERIEDVKVLTRAFLDQDVMAGGEENEEGQE